MWDICQQANISTIEAYEKNVDSISFSNNGFYLASGSNIDNSIKIWDLRKLSVVNEIKLENKFDLKKIKFDTTGTYLGFCGVKLGVVNTKTAEIIIEFDDHKDVIYDFAFSTNCNFIASASYDKTIKVFSL
jgi:pre-mRNA-processing factor 19